MCLTLLLAIIPMAGQMNVLAPPLQSSYNRISTRCFVSGRFGLASVYACVGHHSFDAWAGEGVHSGGTNARVRIS